MEKFKKFGVFMVMLVGGLVLLSVAGKFIPEDYKKFVRI